MTNTLMVMMRTVMEILFLIMKKKRKNIKKLEEIMYLQTLITQNASQQLFVHLGMLLVKSHHYY